MRWLAVALVFVSALGSAEPPPGLGSATSPYLEEHAQDPIDWRPWGSAAFDRARQEGKPLFVSIGRFGCHECRRRERQVFSVARTATILQPFICIKVDADERPDVEDVYATAVSTLGGGRGSPLSVFLLPDGRPFLGRAETLEDGVSAETEFTAFALRALFEMKNDRAAADAAAARALEAIRAAQEQAQGRGGLVPGSVDVALRSFRESVGSVGNSRGLGPLRALLEAHSRNADDEALRLVRRALDGLATSALRDRAKGGFVESSGPVPRKTLRQNALLLRLYSEAYAVTEDAGFREVAMDIAAWAMRELRDSSGAFCAAAEGSSEGGVCVDERVHAGQNGLMIGALARSGSALGRSEHIEAARRAASSVLERLGPIASLRRCARGVHVGDPGFLDDYGFLADGLLDLQEATREERWRSASEDLVNAAVARFYDASRGGFYLNDAAHLPLPVRIKTAFEGSQPSANGVMAGVLLRLSSLTGQARYAALARQTVETFAGDLERAPQGMATLVSVASRLAPSRTTALDQPLHRPARETRGGITIEASLWPNGVRPGNGAEVRLRLTIAPAWSVVARPAVKGYQPLIVSAATPDLTVEPPRYPEPPPIAERWGVQGFPAYVNEALITVPVRIGPSMPAGEARFRVLVRFQACERGDCRAPENAVLDVPATILKP